MESIIKDAYETNFGTAYETYKIAIKQNPSIRLQDVNDYLNKLESVQVKSKYKHNIIALSVQKQGSSMKLI